MNVVYLTSGKSWSGTDRRALELCKALRADGHFVAAVSRGNTAPAKRFMADELLYAAMPMRGLAALWLSPVRLASFINRLDPSNGDVVILISNLNDAALALTARRLTRFDGRVKVVASVRDHFPKRNSSRLKALSEIDALVFASDSARERFKAQFGEQHAERMAVVADSVNLPVFDGEKPSTPPVNIIFSGRITKDSGLDVLIKSLEKIKDQPWHLTVCGAGTGNVVMPMVRYARTNGLADRIDWKGHVDDIDAEYRNAHVAVFPSRVDGALSMALVEAMSQGCAIIASNHTGMVQLLADSDAALLVEPDPASMAQALRRVIEDKALREKLAANSRQTFADKLSYNEFYSSHLAVMQR